MTRLRAAAGPAWLAALLALALGLTASLTLLGCGRKAMPVPPGAPQALKPTLSFEAQGEVCVLSWRYPAREALQPEAFQVLRARLDTACKECPPRYAQVGLVPVSPLGVYDFRDTELAAGATYSYQVMPLFGRGVEGPPSDPLTLVWRGAAPPAGVVAAAIPGGVRIFWEPEVGARGYAVYRGTGTGPLERLGEIEAPPFLDERVVTGQSYRYAVASVTASGEGPLSAPVQAVVPRPAE